MVDILFKKGLIAIETKKCSQCEKSYPLDIEYFALRQGSKDGFRGTCRKCQNINTDILRYKNKYGINLINGISDYDVIQWYKWTTIEKTSNGKLINRIPYEFQNEIQYIKIWKYVILDILKYDNKEKLLHFNSDQIKHYSISFCASMRNNKSYTCYEIISLCFPQFDIREWEMQNTTPHYFKDKQNVYYALEWMFNKNNYTIEDVKSCKVNRLTLVENNLYVITELYNKNITDLYIWFCQKYFSIALSYSDFRVKTIGYWNSKDNCDLELKRYVKSLFDQELINEVNFKNSLAKFFNAKWLYLNGYTYLVNANYKNYNTAVFYDWLNELYPEWDLKPSDFKLFIGIDGKSILDSAEEKFVFDYIYQDFFINSIKSIGTKRNKKYMFIDEDRKYYPDFVIEYYNGKLLNKPIIIEYYGLYNDKSVFGYYKEYKDKTIKKDLYFKNNPDINYIGIFPKSLKCNLSDIKDELFLFLAS